MENKFIGRDQELKLLQEKYQSKNSQLVALYGRRRVGKSALIAQFLKKKKNTFRFEGLEDEEMPAQIEEFTKALAKQSQDTTLMGIRFKSWSDLFMYFTDHCLSGAAKKIIFLDELQWMAAGRSKLISLIKYYWDNHWKNKNVMLILCGSVASFMVQKVIKSKALYGRVNLEILLKQLSPDQAAQFFKSKRSKEEILQYLMLFGGVPKYLEEIELNRSFKHNINRLCFNSNGFMFNESERIFYNQFKEARTYKAIVKLLLEKAYSFQEISTKLAIASGGGLKYYLRNLEQAEIIKSYVSFDIAFNSKFRKYRLADEFLIFYYKFIEAGVNDIQEASSKDWFSILLEPHWKPWLGFAFERFCLKHSHYLAQRMGFSEELISAGPYFGKQDHRFQADLIYKRADKVLVLCEIKYHDKKISPKIIPEIERKCALLPVPKGYSLEKALISLSGVDKALEATEYFDYILSIDDLF